MILTISTTHRPATDIGYLLYKNPSQVQSFDMSFGKAHVFYPEATEERCTVALLLDVDPVGLVRNRRGPAGSGFALEQYVNDRPYVASSFLSVSIAKIFGSALNGKSKERPELVDVILPLTVEIPTLPCKAGETFIRRLFEPLGYQLTITSHTLDQKFPEWGASPSYTVKLEHKLRLRELLAHLYVLIPVLDDEKHYWVGDDEIEKLMRHGEGWLPTHPAREEITHRYLKHQRSLTEEAMERLVADDDRHADEKEEAHLVEEERLEKTISLKEQRMQAVLKALRETDAKRVLDLGCGEGQLLRYLLEDRNFREIVGMDVSHRSLEKAHKRLRTEQLPTMQRERIKLFQGSLTYRDKRLEGFDAAMLIEVIEHLELPRLATLERVVFEFARPKSVVVTTPNSEYNVKFPNLPAGKFRHKDHRFEWTRSEFQAWCKSIADKFGYASDFLSVGPSDSAVGSPTQMAVFRKQ